MNRLCRGGVASRDLSARCRAGFPRRMLNPEENVIVRRFEWKRRWFPLTAKKLSKTYVW